MGGCCSRDDVVQEGLGRKEEDEVYHEFYDEGGSEGSASVKKVGTRVRLKGSCGFASMYTQQGLKGVNQDAMVVWEVILPWIFFLGWKTDILIQGFCLYVFWESKRINDCISFEIFFKIY